MDRDMDRVSFMIDMKEYPPLNTSYNRTFY